MNKIVEELLTKIKAKQPVDALLLVGNIRTPKIPDEVFTIVRKANGEEFKRYLEADKWIAWLNSVADKNVNPEADIEEQSIVGTAFYNQCVLSIREIDREEKKGQAGTRWLDNGSIYSIALNGEQIQEAKDSLQRVQGTSIVPVAQEFKNIEDTFDMERTKAYLDIVKGHDMR